MNGNKVTNCKHEDAHVSTPRWRIGAMENEASRILDVCTFVISNQFTFGHFALTIRKEPQYVPDVRKIFPSA